MGALFQTITDLKAGADVVRHRRYGIVEVGDHGRLLAVHLRPWPKLVSIASVIFGQRYHDRVSGDRLWLYYNQPIRHSNFLAFKFVVSARNTSWATARRALEALDEIAEIKKSSAILCDAANYRLSARLLAREGWVPHAPSQWHRNYIKRFNRKPSETRVFFAEADAVPAASLSSQTGVTAGA